MTTVQRLCGLVVLLAAGWLLASAAAPPPKWPKSPIDGGPWYATLSNGVSWTVTHWRYDKKFRGYVLLVQEDGEPEMQVFVGQDNFGYLVPVSDG